MEIIYPSAHNKKIEIPIPADIKKAFDKYYKNACLVNIDNESITTDILMASWLATFANSADFADMEKQAQEIKDEAKAEKERKKQEREAKKAEREAAKEAKRQEKIAKLQAEIDKLKED